MHCPKCAADLSDTASECPRCGIVFARYAQHEAAINGMYEGSVQPVPVVSPDAASGANNAATLFFGGAPATAAATWGRALLLVLLAAWTLSLVSAGVSADRMNSSFLHLPNLVFHEAGHILWSPFGRFLTVLGGSLTQVLVPLVCAGAFLWQTRDPFAASVAAWWAGENLLDVAPYINDARDLKLILLGGKTGAEVEGHDWEYLLNAMGIAYKDHTIAAAVQAVGALIMIAALVWGALVIASQRRSQPLTDLTP